LNYAIDLAAHGSASLTVMTVAELPSSRLPTMRSKDIYGPYLSMVKESRKKILNDAIATITERVPNIQVDRILAIGDPATKITEAGVAGNYDLIITGCRELNKGSQFLLGSVSNKVQKIAPCPVMVVKSTAPGK